MRDSDYVPIDIDDIRHETTLAYLVQIDDTQVWIPKDCVASMDSDTKPRELMVAEWFAEKQGLI